MVGVEKVIEAVISQLAKAVTGKAVGLARNAYDPIVRAASKLTLVGLKDQYGAEFISIWGSANFIDGLSSSYGPDELRQAIEQVKDGEWKYDETKLSAAISEAFASQLPHLGEHTPVFVRTFMQALQRLLKEDTNALMKHIFTVVHDTSKAVGDLANMVARFQSSLERVEVNITELALRDALTRSEIANCEGVLRLCDVHIQHLEYHKAAIAVAPIEPMVLASQEPKLIGRYYNTYAQIESRSGSNCSSKVLEYLQKASNYLPDNKVIKVNLAFYHYNRREPERAREYMNSVPAKDQDFANFFNLKGLLALGDHNFSEALDCFRVIPTLDTGHWEGRANLGRLLVQLGHIEEGAEVYTKLKTENPRHLSSYIGLANIHYEISGKAPIGSEKQIIELKKASEWNRRGLEVAEVLKVPDAYIAEDLALLFGNLGAIECWLDNVEEGLSLLVRSRDLNPIEPSPHFNIAQVHHRLGQYRLAVEEYEKAISLGRNDYITRANLAAMHLAIFISDHDAGSLEKSEMLGKTLVDENPCTVALENLCSVYFLQKHFSKVYKLCERVLHTNGRCVHALTQLAEYHAKMNAMDKAVGNWEMALQIEPDNFNANYNLGRHEFESRHWEEAIKHLALCVKPSMLTSNQLIDSYVLLASCHRFLNNIRAALETLTIGLKRYPKNELLERTIAHIVGVTREKSPTIFLRRPQASSGL